MSTTDGALVYAIGDVHGCYDLMKALLADIAADYAARADGRRPVLVFLGDYVDRGPQSPKVLEIITPADPRQRGCQLSLLVHRNGRGVFDQLTAGGVILDWREPNVIRVAPTPLYNTFEEVFRFAAILRESLGEL